MTPLAAYILLFVAVGCGFILVHLIAGKLFRPRLPGSEKGTIYECGEPTIGSAWIQFDLRFYVVALLFVIFDVEVAFFFPWAEVFGKANAVANMPPPPQGDAQALAKYRQEVLPLLGSGHTLPSDKYEARVPDEEFAQNRKDAQSLAQLALVEILVFFGVLLVGFAYLWHRGDLQWVRSLAAAGEAAAPPPPPTGPSPAPTRTLDLPVPVSK